MIAQLELVKGMPLMPHHCTLCSNNPVDEITGQQQEHVFVPGVDVNYGDSVYICHSCAEIIADLIGRSTRAGFDEIERKYRNLKAEHEVLEGNYEREKTFVDRIKDGNKAIKEVKASDKPAKKKVAA